MELRHYASILWRWVWLLTLGTSIAAISGFFYTSGQPRIYATTTTLLVSQAQGSGGASYYADITGSSSLARTYGEMIRRDPVLERAIAEMGLPYGPEQLAGMVSVQVIRDTTLLSLTAESPSPQLSADIANAIARAFIEQTREAQMGRVASSRDSLQQQLRVMEDTIASTTRDLERVRSGADNRTPEGRQAEMARLQGILSQYQPLYAELVRSEREAQLAEARAFDNMVVVEPAKIRPVPVRPRVAQNVLVAALMGLLLAGAIALLAEYLDDTVKTGEDVRRVLDAPALGYVPKLNKRDAQLLARPIEGHLPHMVAEAFRALRTNLRFTSLSQPGRSLVLTSGGPGEGKTTVATNLALALAQDGQRVVLVDADLRRPSLHRCFGLPNDVGLSTALMDPAVLSQGAVQPTGVNNLLVMTSGPLPPNPSELLGSPRMGVILEYLKSHADVVLFDSPPALVVTDPVVLATHTDAVLIVLDSGRTRAEVLARVRETLERAIGPGKVAGAVLNKLTPRSSSYYYYYYYHARRYGYGSNGKHGVGNGKVTSTRPAGTPEEGSQSTTSRGKGGNS